MATSSDDTRIDTASRVILAPARAIFRAMTDAESVASWRPPKGMHARIEAFDARRDGGYRMAFIHDDPADGVTGKTSAREDLVTGRFAELIPYEQIVEEVVFQSDDPAFAGTMRVTTTLAEITDGTRVTIACENVPPGIGVEDHEAGIASTLRNLAAFIE
ncbi:MAG: SRPBCC domain-containing protein [Novosphingobium sp.]